MALAGKSETTIGRCLMRERIRAAAAVRTAGTRGTSCPSMPAHGTAGASRKTQRKSPASQRPSNSTPPQGPYSIRLGQLGVWIVMACLPDQAS